MAPAMPPEPAPRTIRSNEVVFMADSVPYRCPIANHSTGSDGLTSIFLESWNDEHGICGTGAARTEPGPSPCCLPCRSEEHTSELQSLMRISYAVFCLKKKNSTKKKRDTCEKH